MRMRRGGPLLAGAAARRNARLLATVMAMVSEEFADARRATKSTVTAAASGAFVSSFAFPWSIKMPIESLPYGLDSSDLGFQRRRRAAEDRLRDVLEDRAGSDVTHGWRCSKL